MGLARKEVAAFPCNGIGPIKIKRELPERSIQNGKNDRYSKRKNPKNILTSHALKLKNTGPARKNGTGPNP